MKNKKIAPDFTTKSDVSFAHFVEDATKIIKLIKTAKSCVN